MHEAITGMCGGNQVWNISKSQQVSCICPAIYMTARFCAADLWRKCDGLEFVHLHTTRFWAVPAADVRHPPRRGCSLALEPVMIIMLRCRG